MTAGPEYRGTEYPGYRGNAQYVQGCRRVTIYFTMQKPITFMKTTRRDFLKTTGSAVLAGPAATASVVASYSAPAAAGAPSILTRRASLSERVIGHGNFRYRVEADWSDLSPTTTPVKNCHEMVMDRRGRLIMITDEVRNNVIIFDKAGRLLESWGTAYPGGHGLTLWDAGGEEFLLIADFDRGIVDKTTLDGRVVLSLPDPRTIGEYAEDAPYKPTETAVGPNGDVYVADGYGSQYVLQFSAEGEFIRKFGGKGDADEQFSTVHGVAIDDRRSDKDGTGAGGGGVEPGGGRGGVEPGRGGDTGHRAAGAAERGTYRIGTHEPTLLCTSRAHNSIKRFTLDGQYLETIFLPGAYVCRPVLDDDQVYAGVCWSRLRYLNQTPNSGFVTILDAENRVVSNPGGTEPTYRNDGELELMVQSDPVFKHCHDVCVDDEKNLYVCQWNAGGTYPIKLHRV